MSGWTGAYAASALRFAVAEMRADPIASACFVIAFLGSALPLVLLLALKEGAVGGLVDDIVKDPRSREVVPVGAGAYDAAFVASAQRIEALSFFSADTRTISSRFRLARNPNTRASIDGLALLPTADGDPLYDGPAPNWDKREVLVSADAARALNLSPGAHFQGFATRRGGADRVMVEMTVIGVAAPERLGGEYVLAPLPLLVAIENFLDDGAITAEDWLAPRPRASFASFRAYAASADSAETALAALSALGAKAKLRSDDVAALLRLDRMLDWLYAVVALCGGGGFFIALAASLRANFERQRAASALLALTGAPPRLLAMMVLWQALIIVALGLILVGAGYLFLSNLVNGLYSFSGIGEKLMVLELSTGVFIAIFALLAAILSAIWAAWAAAAVSPQDGFRSEG